ncbi:MAG: hypothetical protein HC924_14515 [Synechococcaceae cyanobacterium SM2_3_2]|nr:hypothetical protein [Synechococcaceae cyanobacterium SM2_3_2]
MKLPSSDQVIIAPAKITNYLLCLGHPDGSSKAQFFMKFGFSLDAPVKLINALYDHANSHEVVKIEPTEHGTRYVIEGSLQAADGRTPNLRSVWFIRNGEETPRLVTAYPLDPE